MLIQILFVWFLVSIQVGALDRACTKHNDCTKPYTSCQKGKCVCIKSFIEQKGNCIPKEGFALEKSCNHNNECRTPYSKCIDSVCTCIEGYKQKEVFCLLQKGIIGDKCEVHSECKGRFTFCSNATKTCRCIDGYFKQGQDCVASENVDNCVTGLDCRKPFTACNNGYCECTTGFHSQGYDCIPTNGALRDKCTKNEDCITRNSICSNNQCQCKDTHFDQGVQCVQKNFVPFGFSCTSSYDCTASGSTCTNGQCVCMPGFEQHGFGCSVSSFWQIYNGLAPSVRNYRTYIAEPSVRKQCYSDGDCAHHLLTCYNYMCICRPGFLPYGDGCIPDTYPHLNFPHEHVQPPTNYGPPPSQQYFVHGLYDYLKNFNNTASRTVVISGNYGSQCSSSDQCHSHLHCNPNTYKCDCQIGSTYENGYCVQRTQKTHTFIKLNRNFKHIIPFGSPCLWNGKCLLDGLRCNQVSNKCECAPPYYVEGENCIYKEEHDLPPFYIPPDQPAAAPTIKECDTDNDCSQKYMTYCNKATFTCDCRAGFVKKGQQCYPVLQQTQSVECTSHWHCRGPYMYCNYGRCVCTPGFKEMNGQCYPITHTGGRVGDTCYQDLDCSAAYSFCDQYKCSCAQTTYLAFGGQCIPASNDFQYGYCSFHWPCDINYSECDYSNHKCKCKAGYSKYLQTCREERSLNGRCGPYGECYGPELACERNSYTCKCARGYFEHNWSCLWIGNRYIG